jgi:hypothetical protein
VTFTCTFFTTPGDLVLGGTVTARVPTTAGFTDQTGTVQQAPSSLQATQTAVAGQLTGTAIAATQTALVPAATQTAVVAGTQTAVAATATTAALRVTQTAVARGTQTAVAALTQVAGGLATPTATVILTPGVPGGTCATRVGDVCIINDDPATAGTLTGTWIKTASGTFNLTATSPVAPVAGSVPAIFIPTTAGVEAFFAACTASPAAAPFTVTCTGTTVGDLLQGAVVTVRFANAAGGVSDVTGIALGPGFAGLVPPPLPPPPGLPAAIPQVAIPAVPRPPVQFIPSAPGPLLPPVGRLAPLQAPAQYPEIPVIPESDTVVLLLGGLAALGAVAVARRRRHDD